MILHKVEITRRRYESLLCIVVPCLCWKSSVNPRHIFIMHFYPRYLSAVWKAGKKVTSIANNHFWIYCSLMMQKNQSCRVLTFQHWARSAPLVVSRPPLAVCQSKASGSVCGADGNLLHNSQVDSNGFMPNYFFDDVWFLSPGGGSTSSAQWVNGTKRIIAIGDGYQNW